MKLVRTLILLVLPLALSSCFLAPGAFTASLDLKRSGDFTFAYKGEIVFLDPENMSPLKNDAPKTWQDSLAVCPKEGEPYANSSPVETVTPVPPAPDGEDAEDAIASEDPNRKCTRAEIAKLRKDWEEQQKAKAEKDRKEAAQFAAMFGFNPKDEAANRKLAATMMRYDGWRSVTYQGGGVFAVDYLIEGKAAQGFVFPLLPQGDVLIPFVTVRGQDKGSVRVGAPALIGGGLKGLASQMKALGAPSDKDIPQSSRTRGTFTVTTEGEILTNNTADGPVSTGGVKKLTWDIDPQTETAPEALIKLR